MSLLLAAGPLLTWRILLFAGECLAGATLILLLAWGATLMARRRASLRHLIWLSAFGALVLLPLLAALIPAHAVIELAQPAPVQALMMPDPDLVPLAPAPAPQFHWTLRDTALGALAVWSAGVFWFVVRAAGAAVGLHVLRRDSVAYDAGCAALPVTAQGWELRLATRAGACGPVAFGIFKPVVLLPQRAALWPRERLEVVLLHEFAHLTRRDALTQLLSRTACALYWPNPLVWKAAAALRREAEMAADDLVLAAGVRPSDYAQALLSEAVDFRHGRVLGLAMAAPPALQSRIESILSPHEIRTGVTRMDKLKIAGLGLAAAAALAVARPDLAVAQDTPRDLPKAHAEAGGEAVPLPPRPPHPAPAQAAAELPVPPAGMVHPHRDADSQPMQESAMAQADAARERAERQAEEARDRAEAEQERAQRQADATRERTERQAEVARDRAEREQARAQHKAEVARERAERQAEAARDRAQAEQERAERQVEIARERAEAALEQARQASERALRPEKVDEIIARADAKAQEALSRAEAVSERSQGDVSERLRQVMEQTGKDRARILAQVQIQVRQAMAEAQVRREVALAQAQQALAAAVAQARAQVRATVARQNHQTPDVQED